MFRILGFNDCFIIIVLEDFLSFFRFNFSWVEYGNRYIFKFIKYLGYFLKVRWELMIRLFWKYFIYGMLGKILYRLGINFNLREERNNSFWIGSFYSN